MISSYPTSLASQSSWSLISIGQSSPFESSFGAELGPGKKRLVIDYQPLNMFLQDDKFPLPRRQSMFTFLKNAQIFSKFDLKSGSHDEHRQLLTQFYDIVQSHGIMLSAKKSTIATENIEFLGGWDSVGGGGTGGDAGLRTDSKGLGGSRWPDEVIGEGTKDYSSSFPPLDTHTDSQRNVVSKPFVPSPITSSGHLEPPKPFESVLNWQTQNARAQNDTLLNINSKVEHISLRTDQLETKVDSISAQMQQIHHNLQSRITQLDYELRAMLAQCYYGPEFDQKEREIRRLQAELAHIESEKQRPTLFTTSPPIPSIGPTYHPFASMLSPIRQYDPSKLFGMTHTLFRDNPLPPPPKPKPKPKPQPRPVILHPSSISIPGQHSTGHTPASPPVPPPPTESQPPSQSKDKQPMHQFSAHAVDHSPTTDDQTSDSNLAVSDSHTETDTESSVSPGQTSHTEPYVDIPSEVEEEMPKSSTTNQPPPAQAQTSPPSQKSSNGPWFTFDDLPSHKWRDRLNEMSAWIDLQMLRPGATTQSVLREFATRFTGALRDWFDSLGRYRQLQFLDLPEVSSALAVLHDQFLGDPSAVFKAARRDYLNMKCCSLNAKDLDFHYKRMSLLFYKLNGFNEPTLKHVFLASLPDELQLDIQRQLTASNLSLDNISLETLNGENEADVSSAKRKAVMPKTVPTSEKNLFDEPNDETVFALQNSSDDSDSDQSQVIFHQQLLSLDTSIPIPSIKLQILASKFQKPVPTIGLIDTGAQRSMLNPHILPPEYWTEYEEHFKAVNGKLFTTSLITKNPIGIQIFPNCVIWTKVIGSTLPNKDILLGFDILHQIKHLQILPTGIRVKSIFKPFTGILKLYNLFETPQSYQGLTLDPSKETTEDVLWYIWCLTVLYATKLVLPITPTLDHLLNSDKATSLTWTLLEWFSPIPWWRKKLQHLSEIYNLQRMLAPEAQLFTSVFIIHRPYFQHPDTNLFWTQDQVYEWFTAPHPAVIDNEIQDVLHNYLCQLNHQPPALKDIFHTSLGPQHDLLMIPTPSTISKPKSSGIIIKEERPDYTDFLYQDSQDPWEDFLPLSQHLQQFPQPSMNKPGSSSQPPKANTATKPSKVDKATQTSPKPGYRRDCSYLPCRGPHCKHPKLSKTFFPKSNCDTDPDETESSSEDDYMNLRSP
ncbi:hypothetical protein KPL71_001194 [Citrus sinensis]|uniref:Uncharacterized protein n=1 Tax=Citrus sinensis TaxID=2711 RepID=A0ACB8NVJ2_CITSI|nr:hypothetical protein KPL71_001194 [Citrus sinensis]